MRRFLILFLFGCCAVGHADTMLKTSTVITDSGSSPNVQNPMKHWDVLYRKGAMRRKDSLGDRLTPLILDIANCDTKTGFFIDNSVHEYRPYKVVKFWPIAELDDYSKKNNLDVVQIQSKTVDTGERKIFFGHSARHFITTTKRHADEKNAGGEETTDGWYIGHESPDHQCAPDYVRSEPYYVIGTGLVMFPQIAQFDHSGPVPTGLAVKVTHTEKIAGTKGAADRIVILEKTVEELSDAPLNPSLFELPSGLHGNPHLFGFQ
jgi:hypothetical protein